MVVRNDKTERISGSHTALCVCVCDTNTVAECPSCSLPQLVISAACHFICLYSIHCIDEKLHRNTTMAIRGFSVKIIIEYCG